MKIANILTGVLCFDYYMYYYIDLFSHGIAAVTKAGCNVVSKISAVLTSKKMFWLLDLGNIPSIGALLAGKSGDCY